MQRMLLNINKMIKPVQDAHLLEPVRATLPHFAYLKMIHSFAGIPKLITRRTMRGIQLTVADLLYASLCPSALCFWQNNRQLGEEGWAEGSHASCSEFYQRLHVFSLENQYPSQSSCKVSESMRVLHKSNEWNHVALLLVISALVALHGRWLSRVSKAIPFFLFFFIFS